MLKTDVYAFYNIFMVLWFVFKYKIILSKTQTMLKFNNELNQRKSSEAMNRNGAGWDIKHLIRQILSKTKIM
jgi:hypothetical protein